MEDPLNRETGTENLSFDDLHVGFRADLGTFHLTREASVDFARSFDPQPFHLDDAAAAANPVLGRLSSSGWHTAIIIHMMLIRYLGTTGLRSLAGGRVHDISWLKPVFPPVLLKASMDVVAARPSASRPDRGIMTFRASLANDQDELVATMEVSGIFGR